MGTGSERSLESIGQPDLIRLAELAAQAETRLLARNPDGAGRYAGRLLRRALCQGAARHYLDGTTGIKDFDVWSFYARHDDGPFPYRWRGTADFGPSRFGQGVRVLGAEDPLDDRQQRGGLVPGPGRIPRLPGPAGKVAPSDQGVRVLGAEDALDDRQQRARPVLPARAGP